MRQWFFGISVFIVSAMSGKVDAQTSSTAAKSDETTTAPPAAPASPILSEREGEMPGNQRITWERRRQVPFVRDGGVLNRKETAVLLYVDGDLFPPAIMASIQRGIFYWLTLGLDVGGDAGVFQAMLRIKQEMARARRTQSFLWGWHLRTGYKYVNVDFRDSMGQDTVMRFDDNSWVLSFQNVFSFRFGNHKRRSIYLTSELYWDFDLRGKGLQTDFYFFPAKVGFETVVGLHWNFFIEGGVIWSVNGWQLSDGTVLSGDGDLFATASMGFAYRFGGVRTALPENWRDPAAPPLR